MQQFLAIHQHQYGHTTTFFETTTPLEGLCELAGPDVPEGVQSAFADRLGFVNFEPGDETIEIIQLDDLATLNFDDLTN